MVMTKPFKKHKCYIHYHKNNVIANEYPEYLNIKAMIIGNVLIRF